MAFGRKDATCPRCCELLAGAPAREWSGMKLRKQIAAQEAHAITQHDFAACATRNVVCTHFDW